MNCNNPLESKLIYFTQTGPILACLSVMQIKLNKKQDVFFVISVFYFFIFLADTNSFSASKELGDENWNHLELEILLEVKTLKVRTKLSCQGQEKNPSRATFAYSTLLGIMSSIEKLENYLKSFDKLLNNPKRYVQAIHDQMYLEMKQKVSEADFDINIANHKLKYLEKNVLLTTNYEKKLNRLKKVEDQKHEIERATLAYLELKNQLNNYPISFEKTLAVAQEMADQKLGELVRAKKLSDELNALRYMTLGCYTVAAAIGYNGENYAQFINGRLPASVLLLNNPPQSLSPELPQVPGRTTGPFSVSPK